MVYFLSAMIAGVFFRAFCTIAAKAVLTDFQVFTVIRSFAITYSVDCAFHANQNNQFTAVEITNCFILGQE